VADFLFPPPKSEPTSLFWFYRGRRKGRGPYLEYPYLEYPYLEYPCRESSDQVGKDCAQAFGRSAVQVRSSSTLEPVAERVAINCFLKGIAEVGFNTIGKKGDGPGPPEVLVQCTVDLDAICVVRV
jgi:hypothetical protein